MAFFSYDFTGNRSLVRGDDWSPSFRWLQRMKNPDGTTTDTPVNLTGYTGSVFLTKPGDDTLMIDPAPPTIMDTDGYISWNIPATTTLTLPKGDLIFAVRLIDSLGRVATRIFGKVTVI